MGIWWYYYLYFLRWIYHLRMLCNTLRIVKRNKYTLVIVYVKKILSHGYTRMPLFVLFCDVIYHLITNVWSVSVLRNTLRIVKRKTYTHYWLFICSIAKQRVYDGDIYIYFIYLFFFRINPPSKNHRVAAPLYLLTKHILQSCGILFEVLSKGLLSVRHQFVVESLKTKTTLDLDL